MLEKTLQQRLKVTTNDLAKFCHRWQIVEFGIFGSVLTDNFNPESDVDVLVSFAPEAHPTLLDLAQMERELELAFGRKVDLLTRPGIESSRNALRREAILKTIRIIYGA